MKRDMDLIRKILIKLEEYEYGSAPETISIDGCTEEQMWHHFYLMGEAGLLEVNEVRPRGIQSPAAIPISLTWEGHDFLDAIRSDKIWDNTKRKITEAGVSMTFEIVETIAIAIGMKQIGL